MKKIKYMFLAVVFCLHPMVSAEEGVEKKYSTGTPCVLELEKKWVINLTKVVWIKTFPSKHDCTVATHPKISSIMSSTFPSDECEQIIEQYKSCQRYLDGVYFENNETFSDKDAIEFRQIFLDHDFRLEKINNNPYKHVENQSLINEMRKIKERQNQAESLMMK